MSDQPNYQQLNQQSPGQGPYPQFNNQNQGYQPPNIMQGGAPPGQYQQVPNQYNYGQQVQISDAEKVRALDRQIEDRMSCLICLAWYFVIVSFIVAAAVIICLAALKEGIKMSNG